jgi:glycosyltransferase 2 family protein
MPQGSEGSSRLSSGWKLAIRILVSLGLLAFLATHVPNVNRLIPSQHRALTFALLAAAVLMTFLGVLLSAWRWQRVLYVFDVHVPFRTLTTHYFAGLFVGNALPSTIGGDVLRVSRLSKTLDSSEIAFGSVVLERLTGFLALPILVFVGFALRPSMLDGEHAWIALLVAGITLGFLGVVLLAAGHPSAAGRFADNENWTRFIGAVHLGVDRLRRDPIQAVPVVATAMLYQLSVVTVFALVFRALDLPVPLAGVLAFAPAVMMLQVIPISLSGLGVREGALLLFLGAFGVTHGQAFAAGLLWYGALLLVSMIGAPALALGHHKATPVDAPDEESIDEETT